MRKQFTIEQSVYKGLINPFLDSQDSETWHHRVRSFFQWCEEHPLALNLMRKYFQASSLKNNPMLQTTVAGLAFSNPIGLAAGWDKEFSCLAALADGLGFGFVTGGTVTPFPQPGNEKPRQLMLPGTGVCLNSVGFPSLGMEHAASRLHKYRYTFTPLGVSIGPNKLEKNVPRAYGDLVRCLYEASYFEIDVSSPNTPGLRKFQERSLLVAIVYAVQDAMEAMGGLKPFFIKLSPDLSFREVSTILDVCFDTDVSGVIACNTTTSPMIKKRYNVFDKPGGISGNDPDFRDLSTDMIRFITKETNGTLPIIGSGGIYDGVTAYEKMVAGASLIQLFTAMRSEGPWVLFTILAELIECMEQDGIKNISEIVGVSVT